MKARGYLREYGIELIEKLNNEPKVVCMFEIEQVEDATEVKAKYLKWEGFFMKSDKSGHNKKTVNTLVDMGFSGDDPSVLVDGTMGAHLDTDTFYYLQLVKNDQGYWNIDWVSTKESNGMQIKKANVDAVKKKLSMMSLKGAFKKAQVDRVPKADFDENQVPFEDEGQEDEISF